MLSHKPYLFENYTVTLSCQNKINDSSVYITHYTIAGAHIWREQKESSNQIYSSSLCKENTKFQCKPLVHLLGGKLTFESIIFFADKGKNNQYFFSIDSESYNHVFHIYYTQGNAL